MIVSEWVPAPRIANAFAATTLDVLRGAGRFFPKGKRYGRIDPDHGFARGPDSPVLLWHGGVVVFPLSGSEEILVRTVTRLAQAATVATLLLLSALSCL